MVFMNIVMILINIVMIIMNIMMIFFLIKHLHHQKFFIIDKETYENNGIEAIVDVIGTLWLNEKHIEENLGHKNLPAFTNKYD